MAPIFNFKFDNERYGPVVAFFNSIPDSMLLENIELLLQGTGIGMNAFHCEFYEPDDFEMEPFEGVRFRISQPSPLEDDAVVVSHEQFMEFVRLVLRGFVLRRPSEKAAVQRLLKKYGERTDF